MIKDVLKRIGEFFKEDSIENIFQKPKVNFEEDVEKICLVGFYGHPERSNDIIERLYQMGAIGGDGYFDLEYEATDPERVIYMIFKGNESTFLIHSMSKKNFQDKTLTEKNHMIYDIDDFDRMYDYRVGEEIMRWPGPLEDTIVGLKVNPRHNRIYYKLSSGQVKEYYSLTRVPVGMARETYKALGSNSFVRLDNEENGFTINIPNGYVVESTNSNMIKVKKLEDPRENFVVTAQEDGKKYWISRSVAVAIVIYGFPAKGSNEEGIFLIHRRGKGCPDNVGKWSTNCGYIGWHETLTQAAVRELYEETGLDIPDSHLKFIGYDDPVGDGKENVTLRFVASLPKSLLENSLKSGKINTNTKWRGGEEDEISEFKLIPATKEGIENLGGSSYWAFNHDNLLRDALKEINS